MRHLASLLAAAALACASGAVGETVAEPEGLWTGPMRSATPATLAGAEVIGVEELETLIAEGPAVLVDSGPAARRPDNLPADTVWAPTHRTIPGAAWFPGAGRPDLSSKKVEALLARIGELAGGAKDQVIVSFCEPECWGSWNVGKRLVEAGYTEVRWLPAGVAGWQERNDTAPVEPEPGWETPPP